MLFKRAGYTTHGHVIGSWALYFILILLSFTFVPSFLFSLNDGLKNMCFTAIGLSNRGINVETNYSNLYISKLLKIGVISIDITGIPIVAYNFTNVLDISDLFILDDVTPMITYSYDNQSLQIDVNKANNVIRIYGDQTCTISRIRAQIVVMLA